MESDLCMLCSNELTKEEQIFHPCECNLKYCFYCFRDLFEKMNGPKQGVCPQCSKPLKARIQVPIKKQVPHTSVPIREIDLSNRNLLKKIRVIDKFSLYLQNIPSSLSVPMLKSNKYCEKYGEITSVAIDLKYFPEDQPETYRVFIHYSNTDSAFKAILALNGLLFQGKKLKAEYILTGFCGNFIKNSKCFIRNCKFMHEVPKNCEWYSLEEISNNPSLINPKNIENYEVSKCDNEEFPNVNILPEKTEFENIIIPKSSSKYKPKYIPISNLAFRHERTNEIPNGSSKKINVSEYSDNLKKGGSRTSKGGIFQLLDEEEEEEKL